MSVSSYFLTQFWTSSGLIGHGMAIHWTCWHETGDVISHKTNLRGRLRALNYDDIQYLLLLVEQNPDYFLDENGGKIAD